MNTSMVYGAAKIFTEETLGVGSYGKVCKAKCGQLPCAAKLLHDTMFSTNDPGTFKIIEGFEQECRFLRMIKHPNIVQFLGTVRDPRSQRLVLLMELMDESLTKFLERSTGPLPYHTQLNICHDVALALAYLHSNNNHPQRSLQQQRSADWRRQPSKSDRLWNVQTDRHEPSYDSTHPVPRYCCLYASGGTYHTT